MYQMDGVFNELCREKSKIAKLSAKLYVKVETLTTYILSTESIFKGLQSRYKSDFLNSSINESH